MPWTETNAVNERTRFIVDYQRGHYSMSELCERYGISRPTGYKWVQRFREQSWEGLKDQPSRPKTCPHRISTDARELLLNARRKHPTWGPGKIRAWARNHCLLDPLPAPSTIGDLFSREGLTKKKRRRRKPLHPGKPERKATSPNGLWTADFKGEFKTGDGAWCYPLTVADEFSRYVFSVQGLNSTRNTGVFPVFRRIFREYGLPDAILTDNGTPFSSQAIHGLSILNVWWMKLGINHIRSRPGCPQDNGTHERMHKTLKDETTRPPRGNRAAQQKAFNTFIDEFNFERPHESLGGRPPSSRYRPSNREFPEKIPEYEYPAHYIKRWCQAQQNDTSLRVRV